jgi:hypothetical protein
MPGHNGTGPQGKGSFTGQGMGDCAVFLSDRQNIKKNNVIEEVVQMPRGNGTGPMGMGSMTGRGAGFCAGYNTPGYANLVAGRGMGYGRGMGFGMGRGRGLGLGRAYGAGFGWRSVGANMAGAPISAEQEAQMLKNQANMMQDEINGINVRIKELESKDAA